MGILTIQLKEGKNIEAKDSGSSEIYVKFRVLNQNEYMAHLNDKIHETSSSSEYRPLSASDVLSVDMKGKSKSVKKNPNPTWNDTIIIQMPNSPKGFHLLVSLSEKNFIGSSASMGENIVGLDDLKETKDFWINIGSGSLHLTLSHKADFKSKVNIFYLNETPFIYELLRGVKLNTQLDVLCQLVKVKERAESYVLQMTHRDRDLIISDQNLNDLNFEIPDGTDVKLMLRPNLQVTSTLDALKNEQLKKKAIFDLKTLLQQQSFAEEFLAQGGITAITDLLFEESQRNTVAYALIALDSAMTYGIGWDHLSLKVIEKILSLTDNPNLNVKCGAIKIIGQLATSKNHGYPLIMGAIKKTQPDVKSALNSFYSKIISNFSSVGTDVNIQFISLSFLNNMLTSAPDVEKDELCKVFDSQGLTKYLRKLKNYLDSEPQPYNKENKEHEKSLMELWTSVFPDVKLESRVCEQWKIMGFQGCDPATDFRGMGLLGLKHLLYFATHYTVVLRGMMEAQAENNDTYYPIAVAGINLSKLLYEMFRSEDKQTMILFDHEHAVPEIYCIALQFFDRTWDEMGATYFNFSNVIREVEGQLQSNLSQSNTLEQFKLLSLKTAVEIQDKKEDVKKEKKKGFLQTIGLKGGSSSSMKNVVPQAIMGNKAAAKSSNNQVIHEAVKSGNTKKVSELLRDGISVNTMDDKGHTPLHNAVHKGNLDMVRLLLWKDADVDLKTPTGWTALHEAAKNSTLEIVDILLHKGANTNAETADGVSPLHYLVSRKFADSILHKEVLNSMLEMGADINNAKNANVETPLHYAVGAGSLEGAQFLVEHKANVNMQNRRGYTPLHIAVLQSMPEMVKLLVLNGGDKTIACKEGTLEEIAKDMPAIREILTKPPTPVLPPKPLPELPASPAATTNPRASVRVGSVNFLKELESKMKPGATPGKPPGEGTLHRVRKEQEEVKTIACYYETMTRTEAEDLVESAKKQNKEIYLIRPSSVRGCYALTVSSSQEGGTNYLVYPRSGGGYGIEDCDDTNTYPTIKELLEKSLITAGKTPYIKTATAAATSPLPRTPVVDQKVKSALEEAKKLIEQALNDMSKEEAVWKQTKGNLKNTLQGLSNVL